MSLASRRGIGVVTSRKQAKNITACISLLRHSIRNGERIATSLLGLQQAKSTV